MELNNNRAKIEAMELKRSITQCNTGGRTPLGCIKPTDIASVRDHARKYGAIARARLARLLATESRSGFHGGRRSGELDPSRITEAAMLTDTRLFRRRWDQPGSGTAAAILLDNSGSMSSRIEKIKGGEGTTRAFSAAVAAYTFCESLEHAGHKTWVSVFSDGQMTMDDQASTGVNTHSFTHGEIIWTVKGWNDRLRGAEDAITAYGMSGRQGGNTHLGQGTHAAASFLALRPESRKVLLVLTDGIGSGFLATANPHMVPLHPTPPAPASGGRKGRPRKRTAQQRPITSSTSFAPSYRALAAHIESRLGVEMAVIGIGLDGGFDITTLHHRTANIQTLDDLSSQCMTQLEKCLVARR